MTNFFQKLGLGLKKSSNKITTGISDIFTKKKVDNQTLEELEELLISADLGVKASSKIIQAFAKRRLDKDVSDAEIKQELAEDIEQILTPCQQPLEITLNQKPYIILMVGVNGAGKTTTIGKLAARFQKIKFDKKIGFNEVDEDASTERKTGVYTKVHEDLSTGEALQMPIKNDFYQISCVAGDTFRAAAVEQLQIWGERNKIRVYSGKPGCDAAGLCYDGLNEAEKQGDDIVFIDTAGRLQNKANLMEELKKIVRVIKKQNPDAPHATLLTIDATTGQNALSQVQAFKEMVNVSGLVVTKLDGSAKGGIMVAIAEESPTPIHYIGIGEGIDDLDEFNAHDFAQNLMGL